MIDNLFDIFINKATFNSQVTIENKNLKNSIFFTGFLFIFLGFSFFIYTKQFFWFIIGGIIFVINSFITVWLEGRTIKVKFSEMYISLLKWDAKKFDDFFANIIGEEIKNISKSSLDLLQKEITKRANKEKISSKIIISTMLILFVPLWSVYLSEVLGIFSVNLESLSTIFAVFFFSCLIISMIVSAFVELSDNVFTNYSKWNRLNNLITHYRIKNNIG